MIWAGIIICALLIVIVFLAKPIEGGCNILPKETLSEFENKMKSVLEGKEEGSYTFELELEGDKEHEDIILSCLAEQQDLFENDEDVHSYWFQKRYGGKYEITINWGFNEEKANNG